MKIISRISGTVLVSGVAVGLTMALYSLLWTPSVPPNTVPQLHFARSKPFPPVTTWENQGYFPPCFMAAEKPRAAKARVFTKYKWDPQGAIQNALKFLVVFFFFLERYTWQVLSLYLGETFGGMTPMKVPWLRCCPHILWVVPGAWLGFVYSGALTSHAWCSTLWVIIPSQITLGRMSMEPSG